ncbi:hypothetical protein OHA18_05950 [Kribbella sp. NBC_00709]|nr:hypothetical protein [Kribbella sp. NBC_00709]
MSERSERTTSRADPTAPPAHLKVDAHALRAYSAIDVEDGR